MKRHGNLYTKIFDYQNIENAFFKARKRKRYRKEILRFSAQREENIINIQNHLIWHSYQQGEYRLFTVQEPKVRLISALPFVDRVVQHAINNVIEPIVDKRMYFHSYACRKGKGTHGASDYITRSLRNMTYENQTLFAIKGDIHHYFQSISHQTLKAILRKVFKDKELLWLLDLIIDRSAGRAGIPVGNLTSQLFANLYLNELDVYVKEVLHVKCYVRYMDDFVILSHDKQYLRETLAKIEAFIKERLQLSLNPKTAIVNTKTCVDFCGYKHWNNHKKIRKTSVKRMRRVIRAYRCKKISKERLIKSAQSWLGHIKHADTNRLRKKMIAEIKATIKLKEGVKRG